MYLFIIIVVLVMQIVIPPSAPFFNTKPDLLLLVVVSAALLRGSKFGVGIGLVTGTLQDLFLGGMFGNYTIIKMIIGGLTGLLEGQLYKANYFFPAITIFITTFIHELLSIFLSEKLLFSLNLLIIIKEHIFFEAVFNSLLGIIIYYVLYRVENCGGKYYG